METKFNCNNCNCEIELGILISKKVVCETCYKMLCIKELNDLLSSQKGSDYMIKINTSYEQYKSYADILIFIEYNCNVYKKGIGWTECGKCHCKYNCNISREFINICNKYGYSMEWINSCVAGLFEKK